ncbi:hypothetical protein Glove_174g102 [Diversispora epigaea]|uniref:Uncharacterized protein n=1 Tax=Diversispora epigaea TaxID=1348612 RepID=A0A397IRV9_9GLOM|nr:hypothetical protein Glove_174g102 [Diversispora epigaea]
MSYSNSKVLRLVSPLVLYQAVFYTIISAEGKLLEEKKNTSVVNIKPNKAKGSSCLATADPCTFSTKIDLKESCKLRFFPK